MADLVHLLQKWYAEQCEDDVAPGQTPWQHRYGVSISTFDNPAWNIRIDLAGTRMSGASMTPIDIDNGDEDWITCHIVDDTFCGIGDPSKLATILEAFFQICIANRSIQADPLAEDGFL